MVHATAAVTAGALLGLPGTLALPPTTGAQSMIGYATCSASDDLQRWDVSEPTSGTGEIKASDGRCITVQDASVAHIWAGVPGVTYGIAVLDHCGGDRAQWSSHTTGTNSAFQSSLQKTTKCWLLNVVGNGADVQACEVAVWDMAPPTAPTCPATPSLNSEFSYVPATKQMKVLNSDRVKATCPDPANCCLQATACVSPCVLPLSWGWAFMIAVTVSHQLSFAPGRNVFGMS